MTKMSADRPHRSGGTQSQEELANEKVESGNGPHPRADY
jgi:hypothetical protein